MKRNYLGPELGCEVVAAPPYGPDLPSTDDLTRAWLENWRERWAETPEQSLERGRSILALVERHRSAAC